MNGLRGATTSVTQPGYLEAGVTGDGDGDAVDVDQGDPTSRVAGAGMLLMTMDGRSGGGSAISSRCRYSLTLAGLMISAWLKSPTRGDGCGEVSTYGTLPGVDVTGLFQLPAGSTLGFSRGMAPHEASLDVEDELTGDSDRADASSSRSCISRLEVMLELLECVRGSDLTMLARARLATETWRTMVAGVTVIVEIFESRFSFSREKLTCNSSCSGAVSTEVAGEIVAAGVFGGNRGLAEGLGEVDPDSGV